MGCFVDLRCPERGTSLPNLIVGRKTPGSIAASRCRTNCQRTTCFSFPAVSCTREYRSRAHVNARACRSFKLVVALFGASDGPLMVLSLPVREMPWRFSRQAPAFSGISQQVIHSRAARMNAASALLFFAGAPYPCVVVIWIICCWRSVFTMPASVLLTEEVAGALKMNAPDARDFDRPPRSAGWSHQTAPSGGGVSAGRVSSVNGAESDPISRVSLSALPLRRCPFTLELNHFCRRASAMKISAGDQLKITAAISAIKVFYVLKAQTVIRAFRRLFVLPCQIRNRLKNFNTANYT